MAKKLTQPQQRQVNYTRLRYDGFTKKEATGLVSTKRTLPSGRVISVALLNLKTPFIHTMIKTRSRAWERAKLKGESRVHFEKRINARNAKAGIKGIWDLVRVYEKRYTDKHPEYKKDKKEKRAISGDDIKRQRSKRMSQEQARQRDIDFVKSEVLRAERMITQESDPAKKQALRELVARYKVLSKERFGQDF